jgi:hypothetical protein
LWRLIPTIALSRVPMLEAPGTEVIPAANGTEELEG